MQKQFEEFVSHNCLFKPIEEVKMLVFERYKVVPTVTNDGKQSIISIPYGNGKITARIFY